MLGLLGFFLMFLYIPVIIIIASVKNKNDAEQSVKAKAAFKGKAKEYIDSANKMYRMGEYKLALASTRNSLEALVKLMCDRYGIYYNQDDASLFDLIDDLFRKKVINGHQKNLMHQVRIETNKGSHVALNEVPVTSAEAGQAIAKMERLLGLLYRTHAGMFG